MNLPNLPTDNLYKFMALSGIVITIFFITIWLTMFLKINETIINTDDLIAQLENETIIFKDKLEMIEDRIDFLLKEKNSNEINKEIFELKLNAQNELLKISLKTIKSKNLNNKAKKLMDYMKLLSYVSKIVLSFSITLSILGFYFWYRRVQKYLDINIQKGRQKNNE